MARAKRRHYLPAGHIGYFSPFASPASLRERLVCVLVKAQNRTYWSKAANVGFARGIYGFGKYWDWDSYFSGAEAFLHKPVDNLIASGPNSFKVEDWARLAWYITTLIARGPDLEYRIDQMVRKTGSDPRQISPGYVLNAQRIGSAVVRARWEFVWSLDYPFVLGDRGVTGIAYTRWQQYAYFVPLRPTFGVILGAGRRPKPIRWNGSEWLIEVEHCGIRAEELNRWTWQASRVQTYGPSEEQLRKLPGDPQADEIRNIAQAYEGAALLEGSLRERMEDELLLLKLLGGLGPPEPGEDTELFV